MSDNLTTVLMIGMFLLFIVYIINLIFKTED